MDKKVKKIFLLGLLGALLLFVLFIWYAKDIQRLENINYTEINSVNGVWDLSETDFSDTVIGLRGDVLYFDELMTPSEFEENIENAKIGNPIDFNSARTAKLTVVMPDSELYRLSTIGDFARKIYINGDLVGSFGNVTNDKDTFEAQFDELSVDMKPIENKYELIIQGGNFVHREGTSYANTTISEPELLNQSELLRTGIETFMVGTIFVLFIMHLLVAALLGNKRLNIAFSFVCFLFGLRLSLIGSKVLYDFLPDFPWEIAFRLEYISVSLSSVLLLFIIYLQFKDSLNKVVIIILSSSFMVFTILFTFADTVTVSHLMLPVNIIYILTLLYCTLSVVIYYLVRRKAALSLGQIIAMLSLIILTFGTINDSLYFMNIYLLGHRTTFSETAILIFSLFEAVAVLYNTAKVVEETKNAELEAINQAKALSDLNKMKTEFMQNMSHEMKTPLTVISTGTDYSLMQLNKKDVDKAEIGESLNVVKDEAARLGRMVSGMLSMLSMTQSEKREKVSVPKIVDASVKSLKLMCEARGNAIQKNSEENLQSVFVDFDSFIRVLTNIITNSNEHTENGIIKIEVNSKQEYVYITVSDNGKGIDKDLLDKVTVRGISGKESSGYGLYICKTIIEAHGGELKIESSQLSGTKVIFSIPVYAGQEEGHKK